MAVLTQSTIAACGGDDDDDVGDVDASVAPIDAGAECAAHQPIDLDFVLDGLDFAEEDLELTCTAAMARDGDELVVSFTLCADPLGQPHGDLVLTLTGDWPEPGLGDDRDPITLRYAQRPAGIDIDRWLVLESAGQLSVPLAAIDASALTPPDRADFSYGPIALALAVAGCEPVDLASECGQTDRLALQADYSGDRRSILDGSLITDLGSADGGDSTQFEVVVSRASAPLDVSFPELAVQDLEIAIVARPFS